MRLRLKSRTVDRCGFLSYFAVGPEYPRPREGHKLTDEIKNELGGCIMKKIDVKSLQDNVFSLIGDRWMLITAGTAERCNTMTASWGGLGVLWGKPVATVYIRPQRYTLEFVERETASPSPSSGRSTGRPWPCAAPRAAGTWIRSRSAASRWPGRRAARPTLRRPGWCWCVKRRTGRTWTDPLPGRRAGREVVPRKGLPPHLHRGDCGSAEEKLTPGLRPAARRTV